MHKAPTGDSMRAVIFYATREGQTRRIAEHLALTFAAHGVEADALDVRTERRSIDWASYDHVIVAASVHAGHHEREMVAFARSHRPQLEKAHASFLSVTLSQAGVEDPSYTAEERTRAEADVQRMIDVFVTESGWRPARALPVAGTLSYSKYNPLIRFVMKRIAKKSHASTDTSHDHEFTDWPKLDRFAVSLLDGSHA